MSMERESSVTRSSKGFSSSVAPNSLTSAYCSLPGQQFNGTHHLRDVVGGRHLRQVNVPAYVGSSSSSTTSSLSSEDAMNMRFADLTHMHLKKSIEGHYNTSTDSDHSDRQCPYGLRQVSSSSNGTYGSGSGGPSSRDALNYKPAPDVTAHRQQLSALVSGTTNNYSPTKQSSAVNGSPSSKFHSLLSVKDALLEEKESSIVKLRLQVASLQHQVKDSDSTLRQMLQQQPQNVTRSLSAMTLNGSTKNGELIRPESDYETSKMRLRLAENLAQHEQNVHELQNHLGKTECQLAEERSQHLHEKRILEDKIQELEFCLRARDNSLAEAKKKHKALLDRIEKYKRRVESLERYLGDLPTMEESREIKKRMDRLTSDKQKLNSDLVSLREQFDKANENLEEKEECLRKETDKNTELENRLEGLSSKISDYERLQEDLGASERTKYEETRAELERMRRERDDAAKLLAAADTKIKSLNAKHRVELEKAQERIEQEENATQALRRELTAKQRASAKIQTATTQLASQNQQLMEEKLSLLEQLRALESEQSTSREAARVAARLQHETQSAARDLEAVTQVLIQSSRGDDPNLSALLGVRSSSVGLPDEDGEDYDIDGAMSVETATRKLADVRKLRRDIDELRSNLSNKYAENLGQNCTTQ